MKNKLNNNKYILELLEYNIIYLLYHLLVVKVLDIFLHDNKYLIGFLLHLNYDVFHHNITV